MRVTEHQLRTLLLAQAIEQADTRHTLVSPVELQDATRSAVAAARGVTEPKGSGSQRRSRAQAAVAAQPE